MALTLDVLVGNAVRKPSGFSEPTTEIEQSDPEVVLFSYSMPKDDAATTTAAATLTAIVAALDTYLTGTFIPTTMGIDIVTYDVSVIATMTSLVHGNGGPDVMYLDDATATYEISGRMTVEAEAA